MRSLLLAMVGAFLLIGCQSQTAELAESILQITARSQLQLDSTWETRETPLAWPAQKTAIIICDMWDQHWCDSATARVARMAPRVNAFVHTARAKGVTIVHAPSSTIDFYKDHPARKRVSTYVHVEPPLTLDYWFDPDTTREPALPIDDSDEGCDSPNNKPESVWSRQISTIDIDDRDLISDSGQEIYNCLQAEGITHIILCGVHTNMCVLGRTFGIRGQVKIGNEVVLARDLTDAMYNPEMSPYVSHQAGTNLVIQHIERYWAPSILSTDILDY